MDLVGGSALALALAAAMAAGACATARTPRPAAGVLPPTAGRVEFVTVNVEDRPGSARIRRVPLEDYVAGCVEAELGQVDLEPAIARHMRRLQAILCRTFAVASLGRHAAEGYDLCATTHCQLYRQLPAGSLSAQLARQGARDSSGIVIEAGGRPISALYHANCGGHTSRADAVWGGRAEPYLVSRADPTCAKAAPWRSQVSRTDLERAVRNDTRTDTGTRLNDLRVDQRDEGGRAMTITLLGATARTVRADTFRAVLARALGPLAPRSTMFAVRRDGELFLFEGHGSGHGVGLCQAGAMARLKAGQSVEAILAYYYPGTLLAPLAGSR